MKTSDQFSIASIFALTTGFAILLFLFKIFRTNAPGIYLLLFNASAILFTIGLILLISSFSIYWDSQFEDLPTDQNTSLSRLPRLIFTGLFLMIPAIAFIFDMIAGNSPDN